MVIVMEQAAKEEEIQKVVERLTEWGYDIHRSTGATRTVLGAVGTPRTVADPGVLEVLPGVREHQQLVVDGVDLLAPVFDVELLLTRQFSAFFVSTLRPPPTERPRSPPITPEGDREGRRILDKARPDLRSSPR